ncbi:MAG TPA: twin-arginine translocase subunit TatC [Candidatus Baltobacteraceae bacterium]|jgi:sec-independent protein translocase protein TatC|nr:twin-arginine translocase subunit TatC [Candidatus Baltobacteraceae bacterium]
MLAQRPPQAATDTPDGAWDQKEMTFTEHLRELRQRLLVAIGTVFALAILLFWPSQYVIPWLTNTYFHGVRLHAFGPADVIMVEFKFSIYAAIVVGLPVLLYQLWMFIVPAFHPRTRRAVYAYVGPSFLLALAGIAFAHFLVLPRVVGTLLGVTTHVATATFGIESTLNFIMLVFLAFALIFQTPIIMIALARIGIVNAAFLKRSRKFFLFGFFVFGAIAAPDGNPLTMALMALPMYALYEVSIWIIAVLEKSWRAQATAY